VETRVRLPSKKEIQMLPGPQELILILLVVVVVFGAKRIPEIMQGLGKGIREFKKSVEGDEPSSQVSSQSETNQHVPGLTPPHGPETK
jgi:sec-independent protein translocase protein TatA